MNTVNTAIDGTKKSRMYANILQHGNNLNAIFSTPYDAIALCKKLHRLELKAHRIATDWCNGVIDSEDIDTHTKPILKAVVKILGDNRFPIEFNGDARGYALKISDVYVRDYQLQIYTDWGGYGILAPDFSE